MKRNIDPLASNQQIVQTQTKKLPTLILRASIGKITKRYTIAKQYQSIQMITLAVEDKKCGLREFMKDQKYNNKEEILQKYYFRDQLQLKMPELVEYYKYYTQTSIIYQRNVFKIMYKCRQMKKQVQYNKLKNILHIESKHFSSREQESSHTMTTSSARYILSKLHLTCIKNEESQILMKLKNRLQQNYGVNCFRTIEELDKNYNFQKKKVDNCMIDSNRFHQFSSSNHQKQNRLLIQKCSKKTQHIKFSSCEINIPEIPVLKRNTKYRSLRKKKNLSMDNMDVLMKNYNIKQAASKAIQELITKKGSQKGRKKKKIVSQQNLREIGRDKVIRQTIQSKKQKIKKQKGEVAKKLKKNQGLTLKTKISLTQLEKQNKRLVRIIFN